MGFVLVYVLSFGLTVVALKSQPPSEAESILAINRAHDAGDRFANAWNDWARQHDRFKTSKADRERSRLMFSRFKEFRRLYQDSER